jgi:catechol 2,3-dioxygenase-like lactoylglutathione lyase family enzyme
MTIAGLDHVTINTGDLNATQRFYTEVVGLELALRPDLGVPGIWLKGRGQDQAIIHVLEVASREPVGSKERATVDHIALHATDFERARLQLETLGLPWCGNVIADFGLWQLMFYDPNGVLIELNFKADAETCETPVIPEGKGMTLENFFNAKAYTDY